MSEERKHSPLPWRCVKHSPDEECWQSEVEILDKDGRCIASCNTFVDEAGANGELAVAAVNAIQKAAEALESAHDALKLVVEHEGDFMQPHLLQVVFHAGKFVEDVLNGLPEVES